MPPRLTILKVVMEGEIVDGTTETVMIPLVTRVVDDEDVTMIDVAVAAAADPTKMRAIQRNLTIAQTTQTRNKPITGLESKTANTTIDQTLIRVMNASTELTDRSPT